MNPYWFGPIFVIVLLIGSFDRRNKTHIPRRPKKGTGGEEKGTRVRPNYRTVGEIIHQHDLFLAL